jgi:hypothetical protein
MKYKNKLIFTGIALTTLLFAGACSDILDEQPRTFFEPGFFKTEKGVENGLTSLYGHLRLIYGGYFYAFTQNGTDETTYGQSADNNFKDADLTEGGGGNLTSTSDRSDVLWNNAFPNINTASGIIENGEVVGIAPALIAEAYFFRAWDYFMLVQTFGGVPLDLGAGELKFNSVPSRTSVRNTVPEVYTKCIFPDLKKAVENLPATARVTGGATNTLARLYLAKAYLTYGWWLQNPNNIPTYPDAQRTDPDGHDAVWYFQQAYDIASETIANPGSAGLMPTYYEAHLAANDRNKEMLLYADHTENEQYGGINLGYANVESPYNTSVWLVTWNYTEIKSQDGVSTVQRAATQELGRPWTRACPTIDVITETFADKVNDSRYDGTFVTTYFGNWEKGGVANETVINANGLPVGRGGAMLKFLPAEPATPITYPSDAGVSNVGAGEIPGESAWVVGPTGISRIMYPGLWKIGPARSDNGNGLGSPNGASPRPYNIAKFSELFLVAAEAAVKGATTKAISGEYANDGTAKGLLNVLRARAGKWSFSVADNAPKSGDFSAAMIAATPAGIDINYVLAERSRELYGEGYRWYDLVRTQKWAELAGEYTICGTTKGDHKPVKYTRNIIPQVYLRPIPQTQLDRLEMTADEKKVYQNPGY